MTAPQSDILAQLTALRTDALRLMEAVNRAIETVETARMIVPTDPDGSLNRIIANHANAAGYPLSVIIGRKRGRALERVRQAIMFEARRNRFTLSEIGRALGGRDHSTVLHGARVHGARMGALENAK